ncbi:MAG: hypothetical protein AAGJ87_11865 [Pseudomonadota bacterium]
MTFDDIHHYDDTAGYATPSPVERHASQETPLEKLIRHIGEFGVAFLRTFLLAAIFTPVLLASFLTVDLPVHVFDRFFNTPVLKPGAWLVWGNVAMALGPMLAVLIARRYGGDEASRVITASWGIAAIAAFAEISYLAPTLVDGDFPSPKFVVVFVVSAMLAQYVAAGAYDVTRGGGGWWRAPLYSVMSGYAVGALVYFPAIYWGAGAPWPNWLVGDLSVKLLMAFAFLPIYALLRRSLRPRGGFGGM